MPSSLHANMLAEMQGQNRVFPVFELTLGSATYQFAEEPVVSFSQGLYKPFLVSMSGFSRDANSSEFSLVIPSPTVTIFDQERVLQKAIGGPQKASVIGSSAAAYFRSNYVSSANHYQFFSGVVINYRITEDRKWEFRLSPDVRVLNSEPKIPYLGEDFTEAPIDFQSQPLWIVYGKHGSAGVPEAAGMVTALPAVEDSSGDSIDWVLGYGQMTIQKLYSDRSGTMQEETSSWAFYTTERGTHRYQMARYTGGSTNPTPDSTVRVDCFGLFQDAPVSATTTPFENPAECIRNFLTHFAFGGGDVRDGQSWESETGKPIATSIFDSAETYFSNRSHVMARVVYANQKVIDVFNAWCDDFNAVPFWSDAYGIAAIPEDESDTDIYHDDRHIRQIYRDNIGLLSMDTSRAKPISELKLNYFLVDAESRLVNSIVISDPSISTTVRDSFDFESGDANLIE